MPQYAKQMVREFFRRRFQDGITRYRQDTLGIHDMHIHVTALSFWKVTLMEYKLTDFLRQVVWLYRILFPLSIHCDSG
jgi:hypothetical protein